MGSGTEEKRHYTERAVGAVPSAAGAGRGAAAPASGPDGMPSRRSRSPPPQNPLRHAMLRQRGELAEAPDLRSLALDHPSSALRPASVTVKRRAPGSWQRIG